MNMLSLLSRARWGAAAGLTAFALLASAASANVERVVEKTFAVDATGALRVTTDAGLITVETGTDNQVRIVAHESIRARSDAQADRILRGLDFTMRNEGGTVVATAQYAEGGFAQYGKAHTPVRVDFTIIAPAGFAADLRTSQGDIHVVVPNGAGYAIDAATRRGDVQVKGVNVTTFTGGSGERALVGRVGAGGATLHLRTSEGNITVDNVRAS